MIQVIDVHKQFGHQKVLDGINFNIRGSAITTIIGRSGGGKSVLLKHLTGLMSPDSGKILIDGENIVGMASEDLNRMRRRFGILFQDGALFDSFTVGENVAFPLREHTEMSDEEIMEVVRAKLEMVELEGTEEKYPYQISGGMRKRVGLARALALDPEIVFFDEPTAGLDPLTKAVFYSTISRAHQITCVTFVMVSHDIRGVMEVSNEILMLWEGKILAQGSPDEIKSNPSPIVQQFITGSAKGPIRVD